MFRGLAAKPPQHAEDRRTSWRRGVSAIVLAVLAHGGVAEAQQAALPPPEPPETESAQRTRVVAPPKAAPGIVTDAPAATSGEYVSVVHVVPDALPANGDPLRIFPPAPPPVVPAVQPKSEPSPAPAPPPGHDAPATPVGAAATPPVREAPATPVGAAATPPVREAPATTPAPPPSEPVAVQETPAAVSSTPEPSARYDTPWSAAALVGVGATFDNTLAGVNPMGFGFGVRGDYRLLPEWAVGARMLYFVGGSVELPSSEVAMQSWLLAAEAAYIWDLQTLLVQPGVALGLYMREANYRGIATFTEATASVAPDTMRPYFYLAPGVNVAVPLAPITPALAPLSVGADVRWDLAFGKRVSSNIQLLLQVGLRF